MMVGGTGSQKLSRRHRRLRQTVSGRSSSGQICVVVGVASAAGGAMVSRSGVFSCPWRTHQPGSPQPSVSNGDRIGKSLGALTGVGTLPSFTSEGIVTKSVSGCVCFAIGALSARTSRRRALLGLAGAAVGTERQQSQALEQESSLPAKLKVAGDVEEVEWPIWQAPVDSTGMSKFVATVDPQRTALGDPGKDWQGLWRVVYAPHMQTMGNLASTRFDVYYDISAASDGSPEIHSFVRFETPIPALRGWLSAAGRLSDLGKQGALEVAGLGARPTSEVVFDNFWVDIGTARPRSEPGPADEVLQQIGRPLFIRSLSQFPTLFFEREAGVTVFRFPPLGVEIAARRVGPAGSPVRALPV